MNYGPFNYSLQPVDELPAFLGNIPFPGLWELAFVPSKSVVVKNIVETVKRDLHYNFKVQGFSSERDFENYVKKKVNSKKVMAAFVFDHEFQNSHDPLPLKVKYHLRFSSFQRNKDVRFDRNRGWETGALFPAFPSVGPRNEDFENGGSPGYITEGFLVMQHALDKAIMAYHARVAVQNLFTNVTVFVQRFPYPEYYHDFFLEMLDIFTPLVILFIFAMNHLILVQSIVWEKENRLKIEPVPVIQHSDPSLVFVFLLCYAIATICFSFMVSTFFNKVYFSVSVGGFIYLATYFPATSFFSNYAQMTLTQKLASCFSSNIAMSLGTKFLVKAEMDKIGIKWSNIFSPTKLDNFVFAYILGMFLFDAFLYGLVAWYIEAVFPGEYGVSKPWNFFLLVIMAFLFPSYKYFEAEPPDLVAGIQIKHMCKEFRVKNTIKTAVKDLSLNLFEGQITVLVGHNGAGKSTTLSILSGLYLLTSGEAYVNGYDVSKQMGQIRKSLGLCPQQDLLFNYLTVSEHLYFYSVVSQGYVPFPHFVHVLKVNLSSWKHNAFSVSLSGGMKRKLSIIIALIGGSKVVILDEPTSGMDPASRRATWNLLQHYKQDRTILLTTHDMDEADLLGDRIAIMVNGSLRCCGSSIFLKKIYGVGYHIDIVKEPHCDVEEIAKIIYYHIPIATLEKNARNELSFILPKDYTHRFETLFTDLEKRRKELGIASFGASITTMEEVFLRVSNMEDSPTDIQATQPHPPSTVSIKNQNRNMSRNERADSSAMNESPAVMFNTGYSLYQQQFCAMFIKKAIFSWRNWKLILILILAFLGSLIFLLSEGAIFSNNNDNEKARQMDLGQYGPTIVPVSISGDSNLTLAFLQHLKSMLEPEKQTLKEVQGDLLKYLMENKDCIQSCIVAFSIVVKTNTTIFTALFNNQAYHSPSLTLAMLDNILFKSVSGPNASLTVSNKPQPSPAYNEPRISGHQMALNVHFGMALLISSFCLQTVTERVSKAKHIQFVSGVYVLVYWLSALLWDFTIFFITCCLLLVMFKYGRLDIYITDYRFLDTMLIFLLYGWSAIPLMYLLSFLFTRSTSAYIILVLFNYLSGIFTLLIDDSFQLGKGFTKFLIPQKKKMSFFFPFSDNTKNVYSLEEETIGKYMIMMSITGFVFLLIIFFLETTLWRLRTFFHQYIYFVIYKAFKKVYFKYPVIFAVKNISLAIQKGECFGLLGFNGAGKTTTFKLLTGDEIVTSGKVFIDGFSITENTQKVKSRIGYCPQSDALLEYMTGREIMIMYARLWGISEPQIQQYVDKWLNSLQLEPHADKLISTYSGGNKRQLSTAIALMGKPSVILLDEPTTGMDPVAQRLLWDAVTWARESGKAIVISSHRMEECDAFCTRLAIMVQGKFMCLGNPQHLKSKFGNIYILNIKAKIYTHEDKLDDLKFFITMTFPGSVLKHENQGILHYYIPSKDNTWGKVFGILEEAKEQYNLEDYSISQITLEQVFLTFANPIEQEKGCHEIHFQRPETLP
uniref:ATP binding cassette subfamily A member 15 n=1 Tax=Sus scrofa TaxID=9823 RepID=F1RPD0_PIG